MIGKKFSKRWRLTGLLSLVLLISTVWFFYGRYAAREAGIREMEVKTELLREKERARHAAYIAELKAFIKDAPIQGTANFIKYLESPEGQAFFSSNPTRQELDALHGRYYRQAPIPGTSSVSMSPSKHLPSKQQRREIFITAYRER